MDDDRKVTEKEFTEIMRPLMDRLIAKHGRKEALRMFKSVVVACGYDPNEVRAIDPEEPVS